MIPNYELRGSRLRCLLLTGLPYAQTASLLTKLASPSSATVSPDADIWMPKGLMQPDEARIERDKGFLETDKCEALKAWWLVKPKGANTPNWDIASTFNGKNGLILIEAKAHDKELFTEGKAKPNTPNSKVNHERIGLAISEANDGLNRVLPGWLLSRDTHYQLCNRFAWTWKLASLGIPTVLIYLGFLNATEMCDQGQPFTSAAAWENCIRSHANGIVPAAAWGKKLNIGGTPLWFLIRSLELSFDLSYK